MIPRKALYVLEVTLVLKKYKATQIGFFFLLLLLG